MALLLAKKIKENKKLHGQSFNFGPNMRHNFRVLDVLKKSKIYWKDIDWKIERKKSFKENVLLNLNNTKAKKYLKWKPVLNFEKTIKLTIDWYKYYCINKKGSIFRKSVDQIKIYKKLV